jgi:phosphoribosylformimino-5-aminoimidazole carboxamide ribotide isomerase
VIDLARVGTGRGLDIRLIAGVRQAAPDLTLLAGGGARGIDDLAQLAGAGVDGVLVATALQDGRIDRAGIEAARRLTRPRRIAG